MVLAPRRSMLLAAAAVIAGCGDNLEPPREEWPGRITQAAQTAALELDFGVQLDGATVPGDRPDDRIGAFAVDGATGTVEIDGVAEPLLLHEVHPWRAMDMVLYQGLVVKPDRLFLLWFYCRDDEVFTVWYEGTDGTRLAHQDATGRCAAGASASVSVDLPAIDMAIPPLVPRYRLRGADADLDDAAPGRLRLGDRDMTLYAFEEVDCRSCGGAGWRELHVLLWDEQHVHVGCLYLRPTGEVNFVAWWPRPERAASTRLAAVWRRF